MFYILGGRKGLRHEPMPPRVYEKKFILIIIYISSFTFQHEHYFQSTYGVGYNKSPPYEVPKELIHLKGTEIYRY